MVFGPMILVLEPFMASRSYFPRSFPSLPSSEKSLAMTITYLTPFATQLFSASSDLEAGSAITAKSGGWSKVSIEGTLKPHDLLA